MWSGEVCVVKSYMHGHAKAAARTASVVSIYLEGESAV